MHETFGVKAQSPAYALDLQNVDVAYRVRGRDRQVLRDVSFRIGRGEAYGLVGESGCGKSTVAFAAMRYLAGNGRVTTGRILVDGEDLLAFDKRALRRVRAKTVSMVYQDPGKALNPSLTVGRQLEEACAVAGSSKADATRLAREMLEKTRIADAAGVMQRYPHELSGGMQQRVCIAMALASRPALLILDEPTTGLDATVEAEVLDLIADLRRELSASILFISHNLAVVARTCDRVGVLYAGMLIEEGVTGDVFRHPRHPYTLALLRCLPRPGQSKADGRLESIPGTLPVPGSPISPCPFEPRCPLATDICRNVRPEWTKAAAHRVRCHHHDRTTDLSRRPAEERPMPAPDYIGPPRLRAQHLSKSFGSGPASFRALSDISFDLWPGETLGVVGESGSGKSTMARIVLGLQPGDEGSELTLEQIRLPARLENRTREQVKSLQIVFQNPDSALNRSHPVRRIVGRAIKTLAGLRGEALRRRLVGLTESLRLTADILGAKPRQLSGGLKQRVAIARAFAGEPGIVVCDEPTSALDVSVQAVILNLLAGLQAEHRVGYIFISHDLAVVRYLADRIMVLYLGQVMEIGPTEAVVKGPHHPYTEVLLSAAPSLESAEDRRLRFFGEVPRAVEPPTGCVFHTRCPRCIGPVCEETPPPSVEISPDHFIRCHLPKERLGRVLAAAEYRVGPASPLTIGDGSSRREADQSRTGWL